MCLLKDVTYIEKTIFFPLFSIINSWFLSIPQSLLRENLSLIMETSLTSLKDIMNNFMAINLRI